MRKKKGSHTKTRFKLSHTAIPEAAKTILNHLKRNRGRPVLFEELERLTFHEIPRSQGGLTPARRKTAMVLILEEGGLLPRKSGTIESCYVQRKGVRKAAYIFTETPVPEKKPKSLKAEMGAHQSDHRKIYNKKMKSRQQPERENIKERTRTGTKIRPARQRAQAG